MGNVNLDRIEMDEDYLFIRQRFAMWASAAAVRSTKKFRVDREYIFKIIENSDLFHLEKWDDLPDPDKFDQFHRKIRIEVIDLNERNDSRKYCMSHGVAAKMINVYMKTIFTLDSASILNEYAKFSAIHPPIDALLLKALGEKDVNGKGHFWRRMAAERWSKFTEDQYQDVINEIREATDGELWRIERFWLPHAQ